MEEFLEPFRSYKNTADTHVSSVEDLFCLEKNLPVEKETVKSSGIHFYGLRGTKMMLTLKHPTSLYFHGVLAVECLAGSVDINGYTLTNGISQPMALYSFASHSALCFSTIENGVSINQKLLDELNDPDAKQELQNVANGDDTSVSCILLIWRHDFPGFEKLNEETKTALLPLNRWKDNTYFPKAEEYLRCIFDISSGSRIRRKLVYSEEFKNFAQNIISSAVSAPKLAICGGKGVGKSSALRFLINQFLTKWSTIVCIDFDIGQPEFTIPGCVSITLVSKPLLGPSYTHITVPLRSIFLGFVNADLCLNNYRIAIQELKKACSDLTSMPWVINTMGYVKGCGLMLLQDILSTFELTDVIKLRNPFDEKFNIRVTLSPENVMTSLGGSVFLDYALESFILLPSKTSSPITPKGMRELMIFFYFHKSEENLKVQKVTVRKDDPSSDVVFESLVPQYNHLLKDEIVAVLPLDGDDLKYCVGFGEVLSFDGCDLYLLTSLHEQVFKRCCIVRGDPEMRSHRSDRRLDLEILKDSDCEQLLKLQNKVVITLTNGLNHGLPNLFSKEMF